MDAIRIRHRQATAIGQEVAGGVSGRKFTVGNDRFLYPDPTSAGDIEEFKAFPSLFEIVKAPPATPAQREEALAPAKPAAEAPKLPPHLALLDKSVSHIGAAIGSGQFDDKLTEIEDAEKAGKARKGVFAAIDIRRGALSAGAPPDAPSDAPPAGDAPPPGDDAPPPPPPGA